MEDQALARLSHHTAATRAARNLRRAVAETRARCRQLVGSGISFEDSRECYASGFCIMLTRNSMRTVSKTQGEVLTSGES